MVQVGGVAPACGDGNPISYNCTDVLWAAYTHD